MKLAKMSLAAAMLLGASAYAEMLSNVQVSGEGRLYYDTASTEMKNSTLNNGQVTSTTSPEDQGDMFEQAGSMGQAALMLNMQGDFSKYVTAKVQMTALSTMGLENNLVGATWAGNIGATTSPAGAPAATGTEGWSKNATNGANGDAWWLSEAWVAASYKSNTLKAGRQYLDTPLAYSETWNIASNSFNAFVYLNQNIPQTTIALAYVGQSNGAFGGQTVQNAQNGQNPFTGYRTYNNALNVLHTTTPARVSAASGTGWTGSTVMTNDGVPFNGVGGMGAYAAAIVNNSWEPLVGQLWYYNVNEVANAVWFQLDFNMIGILAGFQFADMTPTGAVDRTLDRVTGGNSKSSQAYALQLGYAWKDIVKAEVAWSQTADEGLLTVQNTATGDQSKLYTESWWNYGIVGLPGTTGVKLAVDGNINPVEMGWFVQWNWYETQAKNDVVNLAYLGGKENAWELALGVEKSFGPADLALAYIHDEVTTTTNGTGWMQMAKQYSGDFTADRIQLYVTINF